jgi:hypothetical protein
MYEVVLDQGTWLTSLRKTDSNLPLGSLLWLLRLFVPLGLTSIRPTAICEALCWVKAPESNCCFSFKSPLPRLEQQRAAEQTTVQGRSTSVHPCTHKAIKSGVNVLPGHFQGPRVGTEGMKNRKRMPASLSSSGWEIHCFGLICYQLAIMHIVSFYSVVVEWGNVSEQLWPLMGPLSIPTWWMDMEQSWNDNWQQKTELLGEEPVSVPLWPPSRMNCSGMEV